MEGLVVPLEVEAIRKFIISRPGWRGCVSRRHIGHYCIYCYHFFTSYSNRTTAKVIVKDDCLWVGEVSTPTGCFIRDPIEVSLADPDSLDKLEKYLKGCERDA